MTSVATVHKEGLPPAPIYNDGDSVEDVIDRIPVYQHLSDYEGLVEVPGPKKPGYSPIFRNQVAKDNHLTIYSPELSTLYSIFIRSYFRNPDKKFLGYRASTQSPFQYLTYAEVHDLSLDLGAGIKYLLAAEKSQIVTFYMPNCYQFPIIDLATQAHSFVNTCLYDSLGQNAFVHIFGLTDSPIVFTQKSKVEKIVTLEVKSLKFIITNEELDSTKDFDLFDKCQKKGYLLMDLKSLAGLGKKHHVGVSLPKPDDIFTISFTSGTTGMPKGVIITHKMIVASISVTTLFTVGKRSLSVFVFLPLAHCFQRLAMYLDTLLESTLHFPTDPTNPATYFEDMKACKPGYLCAVPRILTKIEMALKSVLQNSKFLSKCIYYKIEKLKKGEDASHFVYDKFLCKKIRAAFGFDNINYIACGSAVLPIETQYFIRAAFNLPIIEGYGLTESGTVATMNPGFLKTLGYVGYIGFQLDMRFRDVPEMGYSFEKNRSGELLIRGPCISPGYWKAEAKWQENLDDGFFCTGDIFKMHPGNLLSVIDRVKNFFKLSQGKFISSEKIQDSYLNTSALIEHMFVYGDSARNFLVAIASINVAEIGNYLLKHDIAFTVDGKKYTAGDYIELNQQVMANKAPYKITSSLLNLLNDKSLRVKILTELNKPLMGKFLSYEMIKNIHFGTNSFSIEEDTLTPTLKLKRHNAKRKYDEEIEMMYKEGNISTASVRL
ncbi:hypothetical protein DASC09_047600 [Saccharomycopsis crataegensis]|uniref:AMP-dependent synthetase/ligase domain-containing protein n=1 Tax=Saccharomycopsis crataegensis TaxID=43959 RepID=A0AAV5QR80_9ASCO|nr:hypothetical protein DASC09_047600 [Saccharomycopsis crataegensis]